MPRRTDRPEPALVEHDGPLRVHVRSPQGGGTVTLTAIDYEGGRFLTFDAEQGSAAVRVVIDQPSTAALHAWLALVLTPQLRRHPAEDP